MISVLVAWLAGAQPVGVPDSVRDEVRHIEELAFTAVEQHHWCDATALFVRADQKAPSYDFIANAARAAVAAHDRAGAVQLLQSIAARYPAAAKRPEAQRQLLSLKSELARDGAGIACPPLDALADALTSTASTSAPALEMRDVEAPPSALPWLLMGSGGVAALGGAGAGVAALVPWLQYGDARARLSDRTATLGPAQASRLHAQQAAAATQWNSWGRTTAVAAPIVAGLGAACLVAGALWFASQP